MIPYKAPSTEDLQRLKSALGATGNEMADLASVAGGAQWRKYTGGSEPREVNIHILFFIAARLTLSSLELERVVVKMNELGAEINIDDFNDLQGHYSQCHRIGE